MKHLLLFFLVTILCVTSSSALSYFPFPTGDASWKVIRCFNFYPPDGYDTYTYSQSGDTTIASVSYHKIYTTVHHLPGSVSDTTYTYYYGAIREDQKKIYMISDYVTGDDQERMIYDFNHEELGDTITTNRMGFGTPIVIQNIVSGIDSVLIDGAYHRRISLNNIQGNPTFEKWTEGIGSNFGLVYASFYVISDNSYDLRCFNTENISYQNDQLLLTYCQTIPSVSCDFATSVITIRTPLHFSVFPIPVDDVLHVHFAVPFNNQAILLLYSSIGSIMIHKNLSSDLNMDLDISAVPPGPYWLQLSDPHGLCETIPIVKE